MTMLFYLLPFVMMFPACLIYMLPLERPPYFKIRFSICAVIYMGVATAFFLCFTNIESASPSSPVIPLYWCVCPLLDYGLIVLMIRISGGVPWKETVYCGIWVYLIKTFGFDFSHILSSLVTQGGGLQPNVFCLSVILCHGLAYLGAYFLIARNLPVEGYFRFSDGHLRLAVLLGVLVAAMRPFTLLIKGPSPENIAFTMLQIICCFFVLAALYAQCAAEKHAELEREVILHRQLWSQHERHMEGTRKNIELLNIKYHDIKHYVAALREEESAERRDRVLSDVEDSIRVFDSAIRTGNEILDTVLTEKSMLCEQAKIVLTCVADGVLLQNMDAVDLFVMLGNALDNAIECVSKLEDPQRRLIAIAIFRVHSMTKIQIENPYDGELLFRDNFPITTKKDTENHGFGLKSIRAVAERYGGCVSASAEDGLFILHILLPAEMPEQTPDTAS